MRPSILPDNDTPTPGISIRTKALLPMVGCILLFAIAVILALSGSIARREIRALGERGATTALLLAENVAAGVAFDDPLAVEEALRPVDLMEDVAYVLALDNDGRRIVTRDAAAEQLAHFLAAVDASDLLICESCDLVHVHAPIQMHGNPLGTIELGMSTAAIQARIRDQRRQLFMTTGVILALGIVAIVAFTRRILGPVLDLTRAARQLAGGDTDVRVSVQSNDELGVLAAAFNEMAATLASSRQQIEEQNHNLEMRIDQRTRELRRQTEKALESSRMKSEFLANMSHEIRTPMNGIIGFTSLLAEQDLGEEETEFVQTIATSAENLLGIINDILDLSKIESGHMSIEQIAYRPGDLLHEVIEVIKPRVVEQGLDLQLELGPDIPEEAFGDPTRLRQVLVNLLGNAVKFTEEGSVTLRAEPAILCPDIPAIQYQVIDTGIGIPLDKQQLIFDAFAQADGSTTRRFGGTGLGLTITNQLVELLGGKIDLRSVENVGSSFTVTLPLQGIGIAVDDAAEQAIGVPAIRSGSCEPPAPVTPVSPPPAAAPIMTPPAAAEPLHPTCVQGTSIPFIDEAIARAEEALGRGPSRTRPRSS